MEFKTFKIIFPDKTYIKIGTRSLGLVLSSKQKRSYLPIKLIK